ncbi:MAG TPA: cyclic nucleotide-binding domain-containing protein [Terriglobales bacterium]|jgi:CRP-like cAMP-binding protein|nr:cyclic nucleotide-binding domain-containing protein [Terriglobales bacterium]
MTSGSAHRFDPQYFADILLRIVPDLPQPVVESLWSAHGARCYSPADFLQCEGEVSQGIFLIVSGLVRLSLASDGPKAQSIHSRELSSPTMLGVNDVMLGSSVSLTAQALTEVHSAFVPKTAFLDAVRRFPSAGIAFSQFIAEELTLTYSRISELRGANPEETRWRRV